MINMMHDMMNQAREDGLLPSVWVMHPKVFTHLRHATARMNEHDMVGPDPRFGQVLGIPIRIDATLLGIQLRTTL